MRADRPPVHFGSIFLATDGIPGTDGWRGVGWGDRRYFRISGLRSPGSFSRARNRNLTLDEPAPTRCFRIRGRGPSAEKMIRSFVYNEPSPLGGIGGAAMVHIIVAERDTDTSVLLRLWLSRRHRMVSTGRRWQNRYAGGSDHHLVDRRSDACIGCLPGTGNTVGYQGVDGDGMGQRRSRIYGFCHGSISWI